MSLKIRFELTKKGAESAEIDSDRDYAVGDRLRLELASFKAGDYVVRRRLEEIRQDREPVVVLTISPYLTYAQMLAG